MSAGLQCFNASGVLSFQATDYLARIVGVISITGANGNGTKTDSNLSGGTPFAMFFSNGTGSVFVPCIVTISGQTVNWNFGGQYANQGNNPSGFIIYGIK